MEGGTLTNDSEQFYTPDKVRALLELYGYLAHGTSMEAIEVLADLDRAVQALPIEHKKFVTHWKVEERNMEQIVTLYRCTPLKAQRRLVRACYLMSQILGWKPTKEARQ